jgi:hypothetical protein
VSNGQLTAGKGESSAVLFELKESRDELTFARDDFSASNVQPSAARDRFPFVLFRSKKSSYQFIANDGEFTAVRGRFIASDDELEESTGRLKKNDDEFVAVLFRIPFVRDRLVASSYRFIVALRRSSAEGGRSSARSRRSVDDGRRRVASREGVTRSDGASVGSGDELSFARSYPYMVTCPYCPLSAASRSGPSDWRTARNDMQNRLYRDV